MYIYGCKTQGLKNTHKFDIDFISSLLGVIKFCRIMITDRFFMLLFPVSDFKSGRKILKY